MWVASISASTSSTALIVSASRGSGAEASTTCRIEIGEERLLERGRKPFDESVRQAPDEADRVGHEVAAPVLDEGARGRVERLEQAVVHGDVRVREPVQERRLAGVRVSGERDERRRGLAALLALGRAPQPQLLQPFLEDGDPCAGKATVGFELRLTRAAASGARATAQALEVRPHAAHARKVVVELRELDLELSLGGHGVLGEDVEDQLRAIDDAHVERVLEPPLLARVEVVVDDHRLGLLLLHGRLQLGELALADVGARVGGGALLDDLAHRLDARGAHQLGDLVQLVGGIGARGDHDDAEPALGLGSRHEIRLGFRHPTWIMPRCRADTLPPCPTSPTGSRRRRSHSWTFRRRAATRPRPPRGSRPTLASAPVSLVHSGDSALLYESPRREGTPLVLLAGHLDTVPAQENRPGRIEDAVVHGLGASDMKGGCAVMLELARSLSAPALDVGVSVLPARGAARRGELAARRLRGVSGRARGRSRDLPGADEQRPPPRLRREPERRACLPRRERALRAALDRRQRDRARRRRARPRLSRGAARTWTSTACASSRS